VNEGGREEEERDPGISAGTGPGRLRNRKTVIVATSSSIRSGACHLVCDLPLRGEFRGRCKALVKP
jgi:hypothetical protein